MFPVSSRVSKLPSGTHAASVGVIGSAHGGWEGAVLRQRDLVGGGGGRDLSGGDCTSENEGGYSDANNELHDWYS